MKRLLPVWTAVTMLLCVFLLSNPDQPSADAQDGAKLGQPLQTLPPLPAPADPDQANSSDAPAENENTAEEPADPASAHAAAAERFIQEGRYDLAVQAASKAIAADPDNPERRRLRARAYQLSGRYEEALADVNPLEVVVTSPKANLKSGNDVIAIVSKGTVVNVTEVRGDWLKVASVGDQTYKWAWIHKRDLTSIRPAGPDSAQVRVIVQPRVDGDFYRLYYNGRVYNYGPYYRHHNYGREYYDWWVHVPPQYWQYLPR